MDRLALVSDGFLCVDGGQTDLSLQSVRNRRWRNSNPAGTALKKLFINGKQSSSQNFYPPISSEKKNKMVFSQFFLLANLKQWVQFYWNWKSGINKEITILCISTKAGSQNITTPEMRDGSMKCRLICSNVMMPVSSAGHGLSSFIPRWVLLWLLVPGNWWLCLALPHSVAPCWTEAALDGGTAPACGPQLLLASSDAEPLQWNMGIIIII